MAGKRKDRNSKLPKGVYTSTKSKKYRGIYHVSTNEPLIYVGSFDTPEETEYRVRMDRYGHHWKNLGACSDEPPFFGFIYRITERKTGRFYIGQKRIYKWNGPVGGHKCYNINDSRWNPKAWRYNYWRDYTGSSDELNQLIREGNPWDFEYEALELFYSALSLHEAEIRYQKAYDVLNAKMPDGTYATFNKNIAGMEFRPPYLLEELDEAVAKTEKEVMLYYMKPELDAEGKIVPFGTPKKEEALFNDLRK